ncbi:MAG: protein phosphatase 2C domain-containing protein [Nakamurella sp.]
MQIRWASRPSPDRPAGSPNEDLVLTGPDFVVVLDGATAPRSIPSGCRHGVAWLVRRLGARLAVPLLEHSTAPLAELLADAIAVVCEQHANSCDLANPDSPSSTVSIVRASGDRLDHLVLADSPVLLRTIDQQLVVIVDRRVDELPEYSFEAVRRLRNRQGGFWVAGTDPAAAQHALTGSIELATVELVAVLSDGASRFADRYRHSWDELIAVLQGSGPLALIDLVHQADTAAPAGMFRGKRHDDATAVLWQLD